MKREHELRLPQTETEEAELRELAELLGVSPPVAARRAIKAALEVERARATSRAPEERVHGRRRRRAPIPVPEGRFVELDEAAPA